MIEVASGSLHMKIHPTAIIESGAQLGERVEVGPYAIIGPNVILGDDCIVGPHAVMQGRTTIGSANRIFQFAAVGGAPQDLKYRDEPTRLSIGSQNVIREFVTIHLGTVQGSQQTQIGDGNLFMANCHVAHDCVIGNNNVFANGVALAGHVEVGTRSVLGGMAGVHQFTRVGDFAMVAAGAMVSQDVPPYALAHGDHATISGLNLIGLQRAGFSREEIDEVKRSFRLLFSGLGRLEIKLEAFPPELLTKPRVVQLIDFVRHSKRGVIRFHRQSESNE